MIDRVVIPIDFSAQSDRAVMVGAALADGIGATVELVTVVDPSSRRDVRAELETIARTIDRSSCTIVESADSTVDALLREVHQRAGDLWCVGSHARGSIGATVVGSVSERLVRVANTPIVLVGPHVDRVPGGSVIAVALDGSAHSEAVLPAIDPLRVAMGMSLRLLEVAPTRRSTGPGDVLEAGYLSRLADRALVAQHTVVDYEVLHGTHTAEEIATYADAHPEIGMIAVGTRGRTGRDRLLHGSVAFEVAHRATVPVIVMHSSQQPENKEDFR